MIIVLESLCLTFLEEDVGDDRSAQRAGRVGGAVLRQRPQTRFTEDVIARMADVWTEVYVQADGADKAFSLRHAQRLFILTAAAAGLNTS